MGVAKRLQLPEDYMGERWNQWIGQTVGEKFPLLECLESTDSSAVFVTQLEGKNAPALIKLVSVEAENAPEQSDAWEFASRLLHPNLIRVFETGKTQLDKGQFAYAVMQRGEFHLGQMLAERALTPAETEEMLRPMLECLEYLHGKGLVHGDLRPQNVWVINDTLKLSSDSISQAGVREVHPPGSDPYRAPEQKSGEISPATDIWALGLVIAEALTRRLPSAADLETGSIGSSLRPKFRDIVRHCLKRDPQHRCNPQDIRKRLSGLTAEQSAEELAVLRQVARKAAPPASAPSPRRYMLPVLLLFVLGIVGALTYWVMRDDPAASSNQSIAADPIPAPAADAGQSSTSNTAPDQTVVREVLPTVPQSASDTITGTIRVRVKVEVDASGKVEDAVLDIPGPSRYFARLAMNSARQWEFSPGAPTTWLLQFQFRRDGVRAMPVSSERRS